MASAGVAVVSLRVHREGIRVLCGVQTCGAEVGRMHRGNTLVLRPGYRRDEDGIYRMTAHATKRAVPRRSGRNSRSNPNDEFSMTVAGVVPCCEPLRVKCPGGSCGGWVHDWPAPGPSAHLADHRDGTIPWSMVGPAMAQKRRLPPR